MFAAQKSIISRASDGRRVVAMLYTCLYFIKTFRILFRSISFFVHRAVGNRKRTLPKRMFLVFPFFEFLRSMRTHKHLNRTFLIIISLLLLAFLSRAPLSLVQHNLRCTPFVRNI
jgi:hypothetical protein